MTSISPKFRKTPSLSRRDYLSSLLAGCAGLAFTAYAGPARAQRVNWEHVINLAGRQRMLSQRMSKETALIALQYNVRENVRNLRFNSEEFGRVLKGLRQGDIDLVLPPTTEPAILDKLARVEELWPVFEDQVAGMVASNAITTRQLDVVTDTNLPLLRAMDETVQAYETLARAGQASSMLAVAVNLAGAQRMLSQKMSKELYMVALGRDAAVNRQNLARTTERFDQVLNGLVAGDNEMLLLPAPTAQIRAQLGTVNRLWSEFRPIVSGVANGAAIDEDMIAETASLNLTLLTEMNTAVGQYVALRPQNQGAVSPVGGDRGDDGSLIA